MDSNAGTVPIRTTACSPGRQPGGGTLHSTKAPTGATAADAFRIPTEGNGESSLERDVSWESGSFSKMLAFRRF